MKFHNFLIWNIIIIIILLIITYIIFYKPKGITMIHFVNNTSPKKKLNIRNMALGFTFGIVFGFVDNFGLMIGMNNFITNFNFSPKIQAALGNTYSDIIGSIAGTIMTAIVAGIWKIDINQEYNNSPLWITTFSIGIGCLLGLVVGRLF